MSDFDASRPSSSLTSPPRPKEEHPEAAKITPLKPIVGSENTYYAPESAVEAETHEKTDKQTIDAMAKSTYEGVPAKPFIEYLIPDNKIPFDIQQLLDHLKNLRVYDSNKWVSWPGGHEIKKAVNQDSSAGDKESRLMDVQRAGFINTLIEHAQEAIPAGDGPEPTPNRRWSGRFSYKPVKDKYCVRKPDGVLLDCPHDQQQEISWYNVLVTLEHKTSETRAKEAMQQILYQVRLVFGSKTRRYALGVVIVGFQFQLILVNRAQAFVTELVGINTNPELFLRVVVGLAFVHPQQLGLDTSMTYADAIPPPATPASSPPAAETTPSPSPSKSMPPPPLPTSKTSSQRRQDPLMIPTSIMFQKKAYEVVSSLCQRSRSVHGRGTTCFLVKDPETGRRLVIKDAWVDESRECKEHDVLEILTGVKHVIEFLGQEEVDLGDGFHTTATILDEFCSTDREDWEDLHRVERVHRRYLLGTHCESILTFQSRKELINGFIHWVEALKACFNDHKVVHRDISPTNLMFKADPRGKSRLREGVLIDFDFAIHVDKHMKTAIGERSGTIPFVAIEILNAWYEAEDDSELERSFAGMSHSFVHDLESIFYVFCWICIVIAGPNFTPRPRSDRYKYEKTAISDWFSSSSGKPKYRVIAGFKESCISFEKNFRYSILRSFHSYFGQPFEDCALELRHLFYPNGTSVLQLYSARNKEPFASPTFEAFLEIFENLKNGLPDEDPKPEQERGVRGKEGIHGVPYCSLSVVDQDVESPLTADDALEADDTAQTSTASTNERLAPQQLENTTASSSLSLETELHAPTSSSSKRKSDSQQVSVPKRRRDGK